MKILLLKIIKLCILSIFLSSCSAALVMESNDPSTKVNQARELLSVNRPIPAERILREVFEIKPTGARDWTARGEASVLYATLIVSEAFTAPVFSKRYKELGGKKGIPEKYKEYLKSAEASYMEADKLLPKNSEFDQSNLWWRLAGVYLRLGEKSSGCDALDKSLEFYKLGIKRVPNTVIYMPPVYKDKSYEEMITNEKKLIQCV